MHKQEKVSAVGMTVCVSSSVVPFGGQRWIAGRKAWLLESLLLLAVGAKRAIRPMEETKKSSRQRSDPGLDIYRGLAVVLMFLAHAWRVQDNQAPGAGVIAWLDSTLAWMDRAVAYVAASFLFIAGFSLVLAYRSAPKVGPAKWFKTLLRRAGWLYLLSFLMFLPEHGLEFPDIVTSSGILSVIAIAVTLTAGALMLQRTDLVLGVLAALIVAGTYALEKVAVPVSGLNAGPGGAVPLVMFSTVGALCALQYGKKGAKALFVIAVMALPAFVAGLTVEDRWLAFYTSEYADHGGLAIADWLGMTTGSGTVRLSFWNPSALGALGLMAPVVATAAVHLAVQDRLATHWSLRALLLLGRHALFVFVAHYALLGLVDLVGLRPPHSAWTLVLFVVLTAVCVAICAVLERRENQSRAERESTLADAS